MYGGFIYLLMVMCGNAIHTNQIGVLKKNTPHHVFFCSKKDIWILKNMPDKVYFFHIKKDGTVDTSQLYVEYYTIKA